jgi:hypothetical protein
VISDGLVYRVIRKYALVIASTTDNVLTAHAYVRKAIRENTVNKNHA